MLNRAKSIVQRAQLKDDIAVELADQHRATDRATGRSDLDAEVDRERAEFRDTVMANSPQNDGS
jgi:hypothetical protein